MSLPETPTQATPRPEVLLLADRFFAAIEHQRLEELRALYAPDALIWHNFDPLAARFDRAQSQSVEDNITMLRLMPGLIRGMRYELWSEAVTDKGFVRQHIVRGLDADGAEVHVPACVVAEVRDGRIVRLDEYIHVGHLPAAAIDYFSASH